MARKIEFKVLLAVAIACIALGALLHVVCQQYQIRTMFVDATGASLNIGPAVESRFPGLRAMHTDIPVTLLRPEAGHRATVLVILRSVTDNPFCARQLKQLQGYQPQFAKQGLSLVVLTQDSTKALARFHQEHAISLPLLSDQQSLSVKTLGLIRNTIVQPGVLVIDSDNKIAAKLFLENPTKRIEGAALLAFASQALE